MALDTVFHQKKFGTAFNKRPLMSVCESHFFGDGANAEQFSPPS